MKKLLYLFAIVGTMLFFSGCAEYKIMFDSNPRGATVKCGNNIVGYTPALAELTRPKEEFMKFNALTGKTGCSATWSTGASKEYNGYIDFNKYPTNVGMLVEHPITN